MERKHNKKITPLARRLRKEMTKEERRLWYDFLRTYPVRFYRQKVLGHYIVDFYCASAKMVIELDGSQHFTEQGLLEDAQRTQFLKGYGIILIRIPNNAVTERFQGVCEQIDFLIKQRIQKAPE